MDQAGGMVKLATRICDEHLLLLDAGSAAIPAVAREIGWLPPGGADERCTSEAAVQAVSGLMEVNGRQSGVPQRLAFDAASTCAGVIAAQGVLAARLSTLRGRPVSRIETSVIDAALLILSHHIAYAFSRDDWMLPPDGDGGGPPFRTADDQWIEIEALTTESWHEFWTRIGVTAANLDTAALLFALRYTTARCRLPAALAEAISRWTLDDVSRIAVAAGVALCRVRSPEEVSHDRSMPRVPWKFRDSVAPAVRTSSAAATAADGPLSGVRVVEATSRLQGPLAGLLLRMLGATVVKVEPPGGDVGRMSPPRCGDDGAFFVAYNHRKESIELNLRTDIGRDALRDLIDGADVFLHNWRPGRAEQLGVDADAMLARNPALIWAHASGWGDAAPEALDIATEYLVQAHTGLAASVATQVTVVDTMGGLIACEGILAALLRRERSGRGSRVDTSLLSAAMTLRHGLLTTQRDHRDSLHVPVCTDLRDLEASPFAAASLHTYAGGCLLPRAPWRFG